jgi:hypothetical protein
MRLHLIPALLAASILAGCYWEPDLTEILVSTNPPGAACVVSQHGQPLATAGPTPAIAIVDLGAAEIGVACSRPGFADAAVTVPPPPVRKLPGWIPDRGRDIAYRTQVDLPLVPHPPGMPQ